MKRLDLDKDESCVSELRAKMAAVLTSVQGNQTVTVRNRPERRAHLQDREINSGNSKSVSVDMIN